jgi:hypothetical protein
MTIDKNTKSTPKFQTTSLVSSCKFSDSLDKSSAFHKRYSKARYKMHTCLQTLGQKKSSQAQFMEK